MLNSMAGLINAASPVAAPSTLGESLAEKLARIAAEGKAATAAPEAAPLAAGDRSLGKQLGPKPMGDMLPVPAPSRAEQAVHAPAAPAPVMGATPGFAPQPSPVAMPAPPPAPEAPPEPEPVKQLTAREQAEAEIGTKRTKMEKLGIALTAAAETLAGLTNHRMTGATAQAMDKRKQRIEERMSEIQTERDRLQAEIDKGIARKRVDRQEALTTRKTEADIKNDADQIRIAEENLKLRQEDVRVDNERQATTAAQQEENRVRDDDYRAQVQKTKGIVLPLGARLVDPQGKVLTPAEVATIQDDTEVTVVDPQGKVLGTRRTKKSTVKGSQPNNGTRRIEDPNLRESTLQRLERIKRQRGLQ